MDEPHPLKSKGGIVKIYHLCILAYQSAKPACGYDTDIFFAGLFFHFCDDVFRLSYLPKHKTGLH